MTVSLNGTQRKTLVFSLCAKVPFIKSFFYVEDI